MTTSTLRDTHYPRPVWRERMSRMSAATHEQAMAYLSCGLAGMTPDEHFPQETGLWDQPCPSCNAQMVWVTEPRPREVSADLPSGDA